MSNVTIPRRLKCWSGPFDGQSYNAQEGGWPPAIFIPFPAGIASITHNTDITAHVTPPSMRCAKYVPELLDLADLDSWVLRFKGYEER